MNNNKHNKRIGLWLDHAKAHFIDTSNGTGAIETAYSGKETQVRIKGEHGDGTRLGDNRSTNNENNKHNREIELKQHYFHALAERLKSYDDIYLFGPTNAKDELYNKLKADKHFAEKIINVEASEQMTDNQMVAKVKQFFNV